MKKLFALLFALLLGLSCNQSQAQVTTIRVGIDAACTTNSIQAAINMAPPFPAITQILISRKLTPYRENININSKNILLYGGYANCDQIQFDTTRTEISGFGSPAGSVLVVEGATDQVGIFNLAIYEGDDDDSSYGGGVDIREGPHSFINFENNAIYNNRAGIGGGISVRNTGNRADVAVLIGSNNLITDNYGRTFGGGVFCENAILNIKGLNTTVKNNFAGGIDPGSGKGGGMYLKNCLSDIGTTSIFGTISGNEASDNGGGILATGANSKVNIYNVNADNPIRLVNNISGARGGAIAVGDDADVTVYGGIIDNNRASLGGGAVYVFDQGNDDRASFKMTNIVPAGGDPSTFDQRFECSSSIAATCNRISNNRGIDDNGVPRGASAIQTEPESSSSGASSVTLERVNLVGNLGGPVISFRGFFNADGPELRGCIVTRNDSATNLFSNPLNSIYIVSSTIADNAIEGTVIAPMSELGPSTRVEKSIIKEVAQILPNTGFQSFNEFSANILSDNNNIPVQTIETNFVLDPLFVDPQNNNYQLAIGSPALDFAPNTGELNFNYFENGRLIDLGSVVNRFGPQDLGAYEMSTFNLQPPATLLFRDGFE